MAISSNYFMAIFLPVINTHPFNGPSSGDFTEARDSDISSAICKSAPRSRQITMPAPQNSAFYIPDALPAAQPTASTHEGKLPVIKC